MKTNFKKSALIKRSVFFLATLSILVPSQTIAKTSGDGQLKKVCVDNFSLMGSVSGNGFGMQYSPMIGIRLGDRTIISGGPVFKNANLRFSGVNTHLRLIAMHPEESFCGKTSLYFFGSFESLYGQYFSKNWIEVEKLVSRREENPIDFSGVRFNGYEAAGGFGVGHEILPRFSLNMELGLSVYNVKRMNYDSVMLYHQSKGMNLHFSLTARFALSRN